MTDRIKKLAERALADKPKSKVDCGEIYKRFTTADRDERINIIKNEFYSITEIEDDTLIAGDYPSFEFWNVEYPSIDNSCLKKYKDYRNTLFIAGGNHKTADFEFVLKNGISGYFLKINDAKKAFEDDKEKLAFLDDLSFVCKTIIAWSGAHADACVKKAESEPCENRKKELLKMAEICRKVPFSAAESFYEAVQSYFFCIYVILRWIGTNRPIFVSVL